jgi:RNA polymerase sigma-70 factor (ECF subfamily)
MELGRFDREYVRRLTMSDQATEADFVSHFVPRLRLWFHASGIGSPIADDLIQETMLQVISTIRHGAVIKPGYMDAYVFGVCRSLSQQTLKSHGPENSDGALTLPEPNLNDDSTRRQREVSDTMRHVLDNMPPREREILAAVFIAERDKDAICRDFGVTRDYLRVLLHRALINARKLLKKEL